MFISNKPGKILRETTVDITNLLYIPAYILTRIHILSICIDSF